MLHNRSFAKDCLVSRNPEADFQHDGRHCPRFGFRRDDVIHAARKRHYRILVMKTCKQDQRWQHSMSGISRAENIRYKVFPMKSFPAMACKISESRVHSP